jgi:hypothetical protein
MAKDSEESSYGLNPEFARREIIRTPTVTEDIRTVYLKNAGLERHHYANPLSDMSRFENGGGSGSKRWMYQTFLRKWTIVQRRTVVTEQAVTHSADYRKSNGIVIR